MTLYSRETASIRTTVNRLALILLPIAMISSNVYAIDEKDQEEDVNPQQLIERSQKILVEFSNDPKMKKFDEYLSRARGVVIIPRWGKAGIIIGFGGGKGVLLARDESGAWRGPAFYDMGSGGIGFQAGVSVSRIVMLLMNQDALNSVLKEKVRLGTGVSVAAAKWGGGVGYESVDLQDGKLPDVITYARSKGLYGGASAEGSTLDFHKSLNRSLYGKDYSARDIVSKAEIQSDKAATLISALKKSAANK